MAYILVNELPDLLKCGTAACVLEKTDALLDSYIPITAGAPLSSYIRRSAKPDAVVASSPEAVVVDPADPVGLDSSGAGGDAGDVVVAGASSFVSKFSFTLEGDERGRASQTASGPGGGSQTPEEGMG